MQVVKSLDDSYEFIAQLDADTIPHRSWLRELAAALEGEHVGAASGNRWYMPTEPDCGSIVRYLWNAGAVVQDVLVQNRMGWNAGGKVESPSAERI